MPSFTRSRFLVGATVLAGAIGWAVVPAVSASAAPACGTPAPIFVNGDSNQLDSYSTTGSLLSHATTADVLGDIAFSTSGVLYGTPFFLAPSVESLDPATGATLSSVPISGAITAQPNGLSGLPNGSLLAGFQGSSTLYTLDPATGVTAVYARALPTGYTSAGDFFFLADGDLLAVAAGPGGDDYLVRLHADDTSTVIGQVPSSYGAAFSGGNVYLAGSDGVLRRVDSVPTTASTDPLATTDVVTATYSMYGAASAQDAAACPIPQVAPTGSSVVAGHSLDVRLTGFAADTEVTVDVTDSAGTVVGTVVLRTDANGTATGSVPVSTTAAAGSATVSATTAAGASATATTTVEPAPPAPAPPVVTSSTVLDSGTGPVSGTADAGTTTTIDHDGTTLCSTPVGTGGTWSCDLDPALPVGTTTVTVTSTNADGVASTPTEVALTVRPAVTTTGSGPVTTGSGTTGALAYTGTDARLLATAGGFGIALITLGAALTIAARRRRGRPID